MNPLTTWLENNRPMVLFLYGQVFFLMGAATALQTRRFSRLVLARGLPWLSAFGVFHALYLWGALFIPWQASVLSPVAVQTLRAVQQILLAAAFAALWGFGYLLSRNVLPWPRLWARLAWALPGLWFLLFYLGLTVSRDLASWLRWSEALARYGLGFPGALLAAYGLRAQAQRRLLPLDLQHIYNTMRVAGLALMAFAVFGGLIVPPLPVPPARWLNTEVFARYLAPVEVFQALTGLVLAVAIIRALEVFDIETQRQLDRMEQAQVVALERERIARDLHDGALQRVYAAGLLAQSLRRRVEGPVAEQLDRLLEALDGAVTELRSFLAALHERRGEQGEVRVHRALQALVEDTARVSGTEIRFQGDAVTLSAERAGHLIAFAREALSNAIRHARSPQIEVHLLRHGNRLLLEVRDYGVGLPADVDMGYGLRNMRDRARLLGGEVRFESRPHRGTRVVLEIPMEVEG